MIRTLFVIVAVVVAYVLALFVPGAEMVAGGFAGAALVLCVQEWQRPRHAVTSDPEVRR